jgi:hypothetical protein
MGFDDTMVNEATEAEDSLPEELIEDDGGNEEELDDVFTDDVDGEGEAVQDADQDTTGAKGPKEPGYVQGRISKAVQKAVAETEARFTAQLKAMEDKYASIQARMLEADAQELVRKGEVKNIEIARELVRARQGLPVQESGHGNGGGQGEQPRQPNGRFAQKNTGNNGGDADPATMARIQMLKHQAERIKANGGPDVIAEWNNNKQVHDAVIAGEMDFYEVAEQMKSPKRRPPSPTRSPNGANNIGPTTIEGMTDAQFRKLDKMLDEGVRFTLKR